LLTVFTEGAISTLSLISFAILFVLIIGIFIWVLMNSLKVWTSNNNAPLQERSCKVVAKRMQLSSGSGKMNSNTSYYVTFEFADLSRQELWLGRQQFGYIVEGDRGNLTFQGTRFKEFERDVR
jgi:hypothetical protein